MSEKEPTKSARDQRREKAAAIRREFARRYGPWGVADTLGYIVVIAGDVEGEVEALIDPTIRNHREAQKARRAWLEAHPRVPFAKRVRIAIVRGLSR